MTCLLTLVAAFGMAQETTKFPITLTTADGLPGNKIVQNYVHKSPVYKLDEAVELFQKRGMTDKVKLFRYRRAGICYVLYERSYKGCA